MTELWICRHNEASSKQERTQARKLLKAALAERIPHCQIGISRFAQANVRSIRQAAEVKKFRRVFLRIAQVPAPVCKMENISRIDHRCVEVMFYRNNRQPLLRIQFLNKGINFLLTLDIDTG